MLTITAHPEIAALMHCAVVAKVGSYPYPAIMLASLAEFKTSVQYFHMFVIEFVFRSIFSLRFTCLKINSVEWVNVR